MIWKSTTTEPDCTPLMTIKCGEIPINAAMSLTKFFSKSSRSSVPGSIDICGTATQRHQSLAESQRKREERLCLSLPYQVMVSQRHRVGHRLGAGRRRADFATDASRDDGVVGQHVGGDHCRCDKGFGLQQVGDRHQVRHVVRPADHVLNHHTVGEGVAVGLLLSAQHRDVAAVANDGLLQQRLDVPARTHPEVIRVISMLQGAQCTTIRGDSGHLLLQRLRRIAGAPPRNRRRSPRASRQRW